MTARVPIFKCHSEVVPAVAVFGLLARFEKNFSVQKANLIGTKYVYVKDWMAKSHPSSKTTPGKAGRNSLLPRNELEFTS